MKQNILWLAVSLAALGAGTAAAQTYPSNSGYGYGYDNDNQARTVRCESIDSRQSSCRIDANSDVRLAHQLSRQSCVRGQTWDATDTRIVVTNGCRAEFLVTPDYDRDDRYGDNRRGDGRYGDGRYGDRDNRTIHCASRTRSGARTLCGTAAGDYAMVGRNANCVEGRTWGDARRGLWVSGKCSANFRLTSMGNRDWRSDNRDGRRHDAFAQSLRCESNGNWRTYCGDVREGPYSLRDNGNRYCVEGSTWGNDSRGLWVSGQCSAQFERRYDNEGPPNDMFPDDYGVTDTNRN